MNDNAGRLRARLVRNCDETEPAREQRATLYDTVYRDGEP